MNDDCGLLFFFSFLRRSFQHTPKFGAASNFSSILRDFDVFIVFFTKFATALRDSAAEGGVDRRLVGIDIQTL
jgi:hypothetical protein